MHRLYVAGHVRVGSVAHLGAAVDVSTSLVIDRPRELVAAWAADPGRATQWYADIRSVQWETAPLPMRTDG